MAWPDIADRAIKATRDVFGLAVTYTPTSTGVGVSIVAPFDEAAQVVEMSGDIPVSATRPMLGVRLADLALMPVRGDRFTVDGTSYEVTDVRRDGQGAASVYAVRTR